MTSAVVVGSGPNGLAAAALLAKRGLQVTVFEAADEIGGGTRTGHSPLPGLLQDECSAVHMMAVGSRAFAELELAAHGLRWCRPAIDLVHPLDGGDAGVLHRSVAVTADGLGPDGGRWRRLFGRPSETFDEWGEDIMGPLLRLPRHPLALARFGIPTLVPAALLARVFSTERARVLFTGTAAHALQPLHRPLSSAIGLGLLTAGHRHGWVVAAGGSRSITDAMAKVIAGHGGRVETGIRVTTADQLPPADVTLFDLAPSAVASVMGDRLPPRVLRALRRFRHGPAAFKVDFAVQGGVPWTHPAAHQAGTLHLSGGYAEIVANERAIAQGQLPERPFVLVGQQYLADPQRSAGDVHPVYSYAHVPHGYAGDATEAIIAQFERFAPGFRERVVGMAVRSTVDMAAYNPNFVGGDIITGAKDLRQVVFGPRTTLSPYALGVPGTYLCSAATPPGPGAHGMCGANAAAAALRGLGIKA